MRADRPQKPSITEAQTLRRLAEAELVAGVYGILGMDVHQDPPLQVLANLKAKVEEAERSARPVSAPGRERLPDERRSTTRKLRVPPSRPIAVTCRSCQVLNEVEVDPTKVYVTCGFNHAGELREVFISADKAGSFVAGILNSLAIVISLALQHGTPIEVIYRILKDQRFQPEGMTGDPEYPTVKSVVDYLARVIYDARPVQVPG